MNLNTGETKKVVLRDKTTGVALKPDGVDGVPTWSVEGDAVTITPAADGLSCDVTAGAAAGAATVTVKDVDLDLGPGVMHAEASLAINVVAPAPNVVHPEVELAEEADLADETVAPAPAAT